MTSNAPAHLSPTIDESYSLSANQIESVKAAVMKMGRQIEKVIEFDAHLEDEEQFESEINQTETMHRLAIELIIKELRLS
jgi:hypothetical protein